MVMVAGRIRSITLISRHQIGQSDMQARSNMREQRAVWLQRKACQGKSRSRHGALMSMCPTARCSAHNNVALRVTLGVGFVAFEQSVTAV